MNQNISNRDIVLIELKLKIARLLYPNGNLTDSNIENVNKVFNFWLNGRSEINT